MYRSADPLLSTMDLVADDIPANPVFLGEEQVLSASFTAVDLATESGAGTQVTYQCDADDDERVEIFDAAGFVPFEGALTVERFVTAQAAAK